MCFVVLPVCMLRCLTRWQNKAASRMKLELHHDGISPCSYPGLHSSGAFALPRSPAGVPTGGLCHSTRFTSGPTAPSAFATSARRVLQVLPGLLYLTAYPNPMLIIARSMAQRNHQAPPDALLHAKSHRREAWRFGSLRICSSRRGRHLSMRSFNACSVHEKRPLRQSLPGY